VRILDMLGLPGVRQIDQGTNGTSYYCEWQPEDYQKLILSAIDEIQPSKVILLGFGSGAYEAIRAATLLSALGRPVTGVIGVAPHGLTYKADAYRVFVDIPKRLAAEIELCASPTTSVHYSKELSLDKLSSCIRYEDLHKPDNSSRATFYVPEYVLQRQTTTLAEILTKIETNQTSEKNSVTLRSLQYKVPTIFIAPGDSWYLPATIVKAFARRGKRELTSCIELPGVCYDFRAYQSQIDLVTETIIDKVGQLLTTGTIQKPRPSRTLLGRRSVNAERQVDTIVLSSARPPYYHRPAIRLAKESRTDLVVLASHALDVDTVAADMLSAGVNGYVVYMPKDYQVPFTATFSTLKHPRTVGRKSNLSTKRNVGLIYGHITGQNLFFLDDDIRGLSAQRLGQLGAHLDRYAIAGFSASDYPDNSVVCHANRLAGNEQTNFISGSSLGVNATTVQSFFPNIYNEDWLFCNDAIRGHDIVLMGGVQQLSYNPFTPKRAVSEEFGDVLAEGLNYLLTVGATYSMGDEDFWRYFLWRRHTFIVGIARRLTALTGDNSNPAIQALTALDASRRTLATFVPDDFISYIQAWRDDTDRWNNLLATLPRDFSTQNAMRFCANQMGIEIHSIGF
jgi:pimeloyl-ACP methyl ester carboxylesterase